MAEYVDVKMLGLRNLNGTLKITVPVEFVRKHGMKAGDDVFWLEPKTEGGIKKVELLFGTSQDLVRYLANKGEPDPLAAE